MWYYQIMLGLVALALVYQGIQIWQTGRVLVTDKEPFGFRRPYRVTAHKSAVTVGLGVIIITIAIVGTIEWHLYKYPELNTASPGLVYTHSALAVAALVLFLVTRWKYNGIRHRALHRRFAYSVFALGMLVLLTAGIIALQLSYR